MSEQIKDDTKVGGTAAAPSETVTNSEKSAAELPEDELSKISGGLKGPHQDSY